MPSSAFAKSLLLVSAVLAFGTATAGAGWTDYATVEEVYPNIGDIIYFELSTQSNPSGCSNTIWFHVDGT